MVLQTDVKNLLDPAVELTISNLVQNKFPEVYRNTAPVFVEFVKEYYQWLESPGNPLWYQRRWLQLNDIDETIDSFLIYFKDKYLANIQLETTSDVRLMIKHALDIYRSKGSPQSIDLLFRLVFGVGADIYFPRTDLFKLSSGTWTIPKYLEVSTMPNLQNAQFVGKQIVGSESGATAFVDRMVRKKIGTTFVEVFYISTIMGNFITGEKINFSHNPISFINCPVVIGSLSSLTVTSGGLDFSAGDVVPLIGLSGQGGLARVSSVSNTVGLVNFILIDGGWGYTDHTEIFVSDNVLSLANVNSTYVSNQFFNFFEDLVQPYALINYVNANGSITTGMNLYTYNSDNSQNGVGTILASNSTNSSAGILTVSLLSGNLKNLAIFTTGNVIGANIAVVNGYNDKTAIGSVIGQISNTYITINTISKPFSIGEEVTSGTSEGIVYSYSPTGATAVIKLQNCYSQFLVGDTIKGIISGATAVVNSVTIRIGVTSTTGAFTDLPNNYVYGAFSGTNATISIIASGIGASANVSSILYNIEADDICCELLSESGNILLDASTYGMSNGSANGATIIAESVLHGVTNVGSLSALININPGQNYDYSPLIRAYDPCIYALKRRGWQLNILHNNGTFQVGEMVSQNSTQVTGKVLPTSNSTLLVLQRYALYPTFINTVNVATQIIGKDSGAVANVTGVNLDYISTEIDIDSLYCGLNAIIDSNTIIGTGSAVNLTVIDSGFAYQQNELVSYTKDGINIGTAQVGLGKYGIGSGFYSDQNGFLSSSKKLYDGSYYQYFSYEVRSSLAIDVYKDILEQVLHTAGMLYFGALYHKSNINVELDSQPANVIITLADATAGSSENNTDSTWFMIWS